MTNDIEKDALALMLRSKTALGRLSDAEVHTVLAFLEGLGWMAPPAATGPAGMNTNGQIPAPLTPADQMAAQIAQVLPPAPVSALSALETAIEKDVKAFLAPIAPPPAQ